MPLGKISKSQIAKGFEVLEQIEEVLKKKKTGNLTELSSQFYMLIPHNFGRMRPTAISDEETLRKKMDLLTLVQMNINFYLQRSIKFNNLIYFFAILEINFC